MDLVMNTVSTALGVALIPFLGLAWEIFPGSAINHAFNVGTFNLATWLATIVIAVLATTAVEAAVVNWGFKIAMGWRRFSLLTAANVASVGIAFASLLLRPPKF